MKLWGGRFEKSTDKKVDDIVTTLEKENEEYAVLETFLTMYDENQG